MYLFSALHGHGTSSGRVLERHADRVQAGHELAVGAEHVERGLAHAGHDPHFDRHVGRVGELHADVALVRAQRAHRERHDVHRAAAHRAAEEPVERLAHLGGVAPVVRRAGVVLVRRADEGPVLDAGDVARIRQREVGVRALGLGEALERPGVDEHLAEPVVLLGRAVAPVDVVGLGQRGGLLHPGHQLLVLRRDRRRVSIVSVTGSLGLLVSATPTFASRSEGADGPRRASSARARGA